MSKWVRLLQAAADASPNHLVNRILEIAGTPPMTQPEDARLRFTEDAEAIIDKFYDPLDLNDVSWLDKYEDRLRDAIAAALVAERNRTIAECAGIAAEGLVDDDADLDEWDAGANARGHTIATAIRALVK